MALGVLLMKTIIVGLATALLGFPLRTVILVGLALNQVGEFSFILSRTGVEYGLFAGNIYQQFLSVSVITMAATPFLITLGPRLADFVLRLPMPGRLKLGLYPVSKLKGVDKKDLKDHLIIIGFGVNGRNVARAARAADISYVIIEMNPETVKNERTKGEPIYYGDAVQETVLEHAGIREARIVVVAINDPTSTRAITYLARRLNPKVYLIVRTRYLRELQPLYDLGANEVIPEEFETSVEIFTRVLKKYLIPRDEIEKFIAEVRSDSYEMFRSTSKASVSFHDFQHYFPNLEIDTFRVSENAPIVGKTLAQIELRKKHEVTLLAMRRDSQMLYNPGGDTQLCANDVLVVLGAPDKIAQVTSLFYHPEEWKGQSTHEPNHVSDGD